MRACTGYKIVYEKGTNEESTKALMMDRINAMLLEEWQPLGGVQVVNQGIYVHMYQTMAQYSKDES